MNNKYKLYNLLFKEKNLTEPDNERIDNFKETGDKQDPVKWDFDNNDFLLFYVDGYLYKVIPRSDEKLVLKNLMKLVYVRIEINNLLENLKEFVYNKDNKKIIMDIYTKYSTASRRKNPFTLKEFIDGIDLFIDMHLEQKHSKNDTIKYKENYIDDIFNERKSFGSYSKYIVSEIPDKSEFIGLNTPKRRYSSNEVPIGNDKNIRASYKDIYLKINEWKPYDKEFRELIIHELAHTMANHVQFRHDDHNGDFKQCEELLDIIAKDIGFMSKQSYEEFEEMYYLSL